MSRNQISPKTRFSFCCCLLLFSLTVLVISNWAGWTAHLGLCRDGKAQVQTLHSNSVLSKGVNEPQVGGLPKEAQDSLKNSDVIRISLLHVGAKLQNEAISILSVYAGCLYLRSASNITRYTWSHFNGVSEIMWPFLALSLSPEWNLEIIPQCLTLDHARSSPHTSVTLALSPVSVIFTGVERWDTEPSSSRSVPESSSELLDTASSLGGGGALAAVFRCNTASSLLLLFLWNDK